MCVWSYCQCENYFLYGVRMGLVYSKEQQRDLLKRLAVVAKGLEVERGFPLNAFEKNICSQVVQMIFDLPAEKKT
jgi:hypothetical protein